MDFLLVLAPLALILAYPIYAVRRDSRRAKEEFSKLPSCEFSAVHIFNFLDTIIALDQDRKNVAFTRLLTTSYPRGRNPPIDQDSFSFRANAIVPILDIDSIDLCIHEKAWASMSIKFNKLNKINGTLELSFWLSGYDENQMRKMLAVWPTAHTIRRTSDA